MHTGVVMGFGQHRCRSNGDPYSQTRAVAGQQQLHGEGSQLLLNIGIHHHAAVGALRLPGSVCKGQQIARKHINPLGALAT